MGTEKLPGKLAVKNNDGEVEYDISIKKSVKYPHTTKYSIYVSHSEFWHKDFRGTFIIGLSDNGNGIKIKKSKKKLKFGYDEALCLRILLILNSMNFSEESFFTITDKSEKIITKI